MYKNQHVTKSVNGWKVLGEGNKKATRLFDTQKDAIRYGRELAIKQHSELIIHGIDGKIRDKDSYGNDPIPPRDKKM